jgi:hypothetical protein
MDYQRFIMKKIVRGSSPNFLYPPVPPVVYLNLVRHALQD